MKHSAGQRKYLLGDEPSAEQSCRSGDGAGELPILVVCGTHQSDWAQAKLRLQGEQLADLAGSATGTDGQGQISPKTRLNFSHVARAAQRSSRKTVYTAQ